MLVNRSGAIFEVVDVKSNRIDDYACYESRLRLGDMDILTAVFELSKDDAQGRTDMANVCERTGMSRAAVVTRMKRLISAGIVEKVMEGQAGKRSTTVYRFIPVHTGSPNEADSSPPSAQLHIDYDESVLNDQGGVNQLLAAPMSLKGERLSLFYMFPALSSAKSGKRLEEVTEVQCKAGQLQYTVTIRPSKDVKAASIYDVRTLVAAFSRLIATHGSDSTANNPFVLDLGDLCEDLKMPKSTGNKEGILASFKRWESTGFKITATEYFAQNKTVNKIVTEDYFRMLSRLRVASYGGYLGKTAQKVAIWFDQEILNRALRGDGKFLLTLDETFLQSATPPIIMKLKLWLRRQVGHNTTKKTYGVELLRDEIESWQKLSTFSDTLFGALKKMSTNNAMVDLGGYFASLAESSMSITFWADSHSKVINRAAHFRRIESTESEDQAE